ncbi:bifunctional diguanylate cyclase/phosphodiesterase [Aeromonas sp. sif2433]|uniref:putative bifunctional diguanylate cyclase/phosphodiesterase n=1 Tax=Aeromonas sp. sif2433 TaxID=2854794 RepID=UPI001C46DF69|nr:GGDEF and EAL domain-containing protein [Aeromonas sp. sif2433]MBV7415697.1 EAL domain-containing protein [Aeromonas sp. sif2433]
MAKALPESVQDPCLPQLSLHELQQLFDLAPFGIGVFDRELRCRSVNGTFAEIHGLPLAELLGKSLLEINPDLATLQTPPITQVLPHSSLILKGINPLHPARSRYWQASCSPMLNARGAPESLLVTMRNIDQEAICRSQEARLQQAEARLQHLAYHDPLTDLGNRRLLQERLVLELEAARLNQHQLALLFIDLDGFKLINDNLGHDAGDQLLKQLARRIRHRLRPGDLATRLGGDEFLLLIPGVEQPQRLVALAEQLLLSLHEPVELGQEQVAVSASIGIALYPDHGQSADALISAADSAMHEAKRQGHNGHLFYSPAMAEQRRERMLLEQGLIKAMAQQQFRLLYQPMTDLASDRLSGLEALVRWQHPSEGVISPARFIPVAEECGLIERLGEWVMRTACQQGQRWLANGLSVPRLSVNVSVREMRALDYVERVAAILAETGFPPALLELEVTESIIQSVDQSLQLFTRLKALGVQIAIDDFGTGFSSLSLLKSLPIDRIKIDRTFVQALPDDKHSRELCRTIVHLAGSLGMAVTAEGIETQSQRQFLQSLRCEEGQGYLFSHPLSKSHLASKLAPDGGLCC